MPRRKRRKPIREIGDALAAAKAMPPLLEPHRPSKFEAFLKEPGTVETGLGLIGMLFGGLVGGESGEKIKAASMAITTVGAVKMQEAARKRAAVEDPLVEEAEKALGIAK